MTDEKVPAAEMARRKALVATALEEAGPTLGGFLEAPKTYEERVRALEAEGLTTSDAQAAADAECSAFDADECSMMRERSVAGVSNEIPGCPVHGAAVTA